MPGPPLLGVFAAAALLLAALGIYGLMAYSVASRRREIGLRMALGASAGTIRRRFLGEGLRLGAAGVTVGAVLALAVGRVMASLLFGVSPVDPVTVGGVLLLFVAVAALASLVPALRASRVDPQWVLRYE